MGPRRESKVTDLLLRLPVALLGGAIAASAAQASCVVPMYSNDAPTEDTGPSAPDAGAGAPRPDASFIDSPSEDAPYDRADGMSYGDGYGPPDAQGGSSCVSSVAEYPPAPGCPAGDHTWACWPPTPAAGGIPDSHYAVLTLCGDAVVVDQSTHLMWAQAPEPGQFTWVEAAAACSASRRAGFSDWRLPSSNELMSLVDYADSAEILDPHVFADAAPNPAVPAMWSSTEFAQGAGNAWVLNGSGGVYPLGVATQTGARCVR